MLIILEGPDLVGKTYLADRLDERIHELMEDGECAQLPVVRLKAGPPDPPDRNPFEEYEGGLARFEAVHGFNAHVICDRWHIGECIYGPLLRDRSRLTAAGVQRITEWITARGGIIVYVTADPDTHRERYLDHGDDLVTWGQVQWIVEQYEWWFTHHPPSIACQSGDDVDEIIELAMEEVEL